MPSRSSWAFPAKRRHVTATKSRIFLVADFTKIVDKKTKEGDPSAEVSCSGKPVIVVKKDVTLKCAVKTAAGSSDYLVTFSDDKGAWDAKSVVDDKKPEPAKQAAASPAEEPKPAASE